MTSDVLHIVSSDTAVDAIMQIRTLAANGKSTHRLLCLNQIGAASTTQLQSWLGDHVELTVVDNKSTWGSIWSLWKKRALFNAPITVYWDPMQFTNFQATLLLQNQSRKVVVMTLPSSRELRFPTYLGKKLLQRAEYIVTSSTTLAAQLGQQVADIANIDQITPQFALPTLSNSDSLNLREHLCLDSSAQLIGCLGEFKPHFRLKEATWIVDILQKVRTDVHVVLIGDGPQREILRRYRDQMWQRDHVHFLSPWHLSPHVLQQLDCILTPGDHIGQSIGVPLANAFGLANVATHSVCHMELANLANHDGMLLGGPDAGSLAKQLLFALNTAQRVSPPTQSKDTHDDQQQVAQYQNQFNSILNS
jgi:glycosyltransferase involved in cell wall biosynthesis